LKAGRVIKGWPYRNWDSVRAFGAGGAACGVAGGAAGRGAAGRPVARRAAAVGAAAVGAVAADHAHVGHGAVGGRVAPWRRGVRRPTPRVAGTNTKQSSAIVHTFVEQNLRISYLRLSLNPPQPHPKQIESPPNFFVWYGTP